MHDCAKARKNPKSTASTAEQGFIGNITRKTDDGRIGVNSSTENAATTPALRSYVSTESTRTDKKPFPTDIERVRK